MFAKLKQKIQEEDLSKKQQGGSTSTVVDGDVGDVDGRSGRTNVVTHETDHNAEQVGFSITDSPLSPVRVSNNVNASDVHELRIAELTKALGEERRSRQKLQWMLEKQQDAQSRRIEEKDAEWRNKLAALEKDSAEWRNKFEETSPWKERYIRDHEAVEELEGFQVQELSKVKHLLLSSQQELQERTTVLKERDADLDALRASCVGLNDELTHLKGMCERLEDKSRRAKEKSHRDANSIRELRELNDALNARLSDLSRQMEEKESQAGRLQRELSDLRDKHASLKHGHEVQVKRDHCLLDVKDAEITHLESRLVVLEKRLSDAHLGDDDRLVNVSAERDVLETKLDECRQHLSEVKSTWSERIEALETQISHLNAKMAEDSEEAARCENSNRQLRDGIGRLDCELRETKIALELQRNDFTDLMQNSIEEKEVASKLLLKRIDDLETRLSSVVEEKTHLTSIHNAELARLEESRLAELHRTECQKEELLASNDSLEKRSEKQESKISHLKEKIEELNCQMESMREVEARINEDFFSTEANLKATVEERDDLSLRIERLSKEDEVVANEIRSEREECRATVEVMKNEIDELRLTRQRAEHEAVDLRKTIADLESAIDVGQADNAKLKATVALLEAQLADRNKAAKLQRQRLGDMKKTLQRELQSAGRPSIDCADAADNSFVENAHVDGGVQHWSRALSDVNSSAPASSVNHLDSMGRQCSSLADKLDDINFRYVKHVILKFMTSTEYEAHQLIKAIGVLLDFSRDEEILVRDTLNWKASWFGTKPQQGVVRSRVGNRTVI